MSSPSEIPGLPSFFFQWPPLFQATALAALTLVQEDTPTLAAALLARTGALSRWSSILGCFLGIWFGDALLYLVARWWGRSLLEQHWLQRLLTPTAVSRSEEWFARKGAWLLVSSRFVPGSRLPTYLAAGFLRLPFPRFLAVTGVAVGLWTLLLFGAAEAIGPQLIQSFPRVMASAWSVMLAVLTLVLAARMTSRLVRQREQIQIRLARWRRWEFWPPGLFYFPVVLYCLWLALRHRSFTLPTAANPGIFSGGMVGESKFTTLVELSTTSPEFTAPAELIRGRTVEERLAHIDFLSGAGRFAYPFVLKPDVGQRGVGVKLIRERWQAISYLSTTSASLIVQRYIPGPYEVGVFYYRWPREAKGRIFAITEKVFPFVTGDGEQTIEQLIQADPRARFMAGCYLQRLGARRSEIPSAGQTIRLVEAGNHAQGCLFKDGRHLWSRELEARIDEISQRLPGFFIGRYDIRYVSRQDLQAGRDFQIVELNGAAAEATNIYDPQNSLWAAYGVLFKQWSLVFQIGAANRQAGTRPTPAKLLFQAWRQTAAAAATYPPAD